MKSFNNIKLTSLFVKITVYFFSNLSRKFILYLINLIELCLIKKYV